MTTQPNPTPTDLYQPNPAFTLARTHAAPTPRLDRALLWMSLIVIVLLFARFGVVTVYMALSPLALVGLGLICARQRIHMGEAARCATAAQIAASQAAEVARRAAAEAAAASAVVQGLWKRMR